MGLYLVRPARAQKRADWSGPSGTRPLTAEGQAQARALAKWLGEFPVATLACGSPLRCRETLDPLARDLNLAIQVDDRLDRDAAPQELIARLRELGKQGAVVCLNRSQLLEAVNGLVGGTADLEGLCERGATWLIEGNPPRATYFAPRASTQEKLRPLVHLKTMSLEVKGKNENGKKTSKKRAPHPGNQPGNQPRVAVLDMGSTSFHLLVAEWTPDGDLRKVARERVMLRMGAELARKPHISARLLESSIEAVRELCRFAEQQKATSLVSIATAALRDADNGAHAIKKLEAAIGGPIHLLSGEQEARFVYRAIRSRIALRDQTHLGVDLGGGSLELVVGRGDEILFEHSLPLGVARMHGVIDPSEPHSQDDLRELRHTVREALSPVLQSITDLEPVSTIAVGGSARAIGRVLLRDAGRDAAELRGLRVERSALAQLAEDLASATLEDRLARPGVSSRRADLIPFGAEILATVLSLTGQRAMTVCDWGLREGVLLELRR